MTCYLWGLPPQNPKLQSNNEKNFRQIPVDREIPAEENTWPVLKTVKVIKERKSEEPSQPKRA